MRERNDFVAVDSAGISPRRSHLSEARSRTDSLHDCPNCKATGRVESRPFRQMVCAPGAAVAGTFRQNGVSDAVLRGMHSGGGGFFPPRCDESRL